MLSAKFYDVYKKTFGVNIEPYRLDIQSLIGKDHLEVKEILEDALGNKQNIIFFTENLRKCLKSNKQNIKIQDLQLEDLAIPASVYRQAHHVEASENGVTIILKSKYLSKTYPKSEE